MPRLCLKSLVLHIDMCMCVTTRVYVFALMCVEMFVKKYELLMGLLHCYFPYDSGAQRCLELHADFFDA